MKKILITAAALGLAASSGFAQGFFSFDNSVLYSTTSVSPLLTTIGPTSANGEGAVGNLVGSDNTFATPNYDVSYLWMAGTANVGSGMTAAAFIGAGATQGPEGTLAYFGPSGAGLNAETAGAGIISDGSVHPSASGTPDGTLITVQLITWYDGTGSTSYAAAQAAGHNVGYSQLEQVRLAAGLDTTVADLSTFPQYSVSAPVPEPSILALSSIGAAALMLVRRKK